MKQTDLIKRYREIEIQTSSPAKLILLLYDEAIKSLTLAKKEIKMNNIEKTHELLLKTQKIIRELMCSLDLEVGKIAINWYKLYEYIYRRLVQANFEKNLKILEEVLELLRPLREAWVKMMGGVNESNN
ncbi:flagellar export chaperone FliS [Candidatus Aerophobetes bacterium]|nr:flagellar export chaperone FliS [Candidatus Aerophobetes bacterium]